MDDVLYDQILMHFQGGDQDLYDIARRIGQEAGLHPEAHDEIEEIHYELVHAVIGYVHQYAEDKIDELMKVSTGPVAPTAASERRPAAVGIGPGMPDLDEARVYIGSPDGPPRNLFEWATKK